MDSDSCGWTNQKQYFPVYQHTLHNWDMQPHTHICKHTHNHIYSVTGPSSMLTSGHKHSASNSFRDPKKPICFTFRLRATHCNETAALLREGSRQLENSNFSADRHILASFVCAQFLCFKMSLCFHASCAPPWLPFQHLQPLPTQCIYWNIGWHSSNRLHTCYMPGTVLHGLHNNLI